MPVESLSQVRAPAPAAGRRLGYVPALDGLRGLAVAAVMAFHFSPFGQFSGGWVGVDVFFALSGFLITSLLLDELDGSGRLRLGRFHLRRLLRLQPALWLFLWTWFAALLVFGGFAWFVSIPSFPLPHHGGEAWTTGLTGIAGVLGESYNWLIVSGVHVPTIGTVWSLSVEEQFYLAWPLVLLALNLRRRRPRATMAVTLLLALASAVGAIALWHSGAGNTRIYFSTGTRAQGLLLGALAAQLWRSGRLDGLAGRARGAWGRVPVLGCAGAAAAVLLGVVLVAGLPRAWRDGGGFTVVDLSASVVVLAAVAGCPRWAPELLSRPWLVHLGKRSYAIYLWSYVFATWVHPLGTAGVVPGVLAAVGAAELSWQVVERRALAWKSRLGGSGLGGAGPPAPGGSGSDRAVVTSTARRPS